MLLKKRIDNIGFHYGTINETGFIVFIFETDFIGIEGELWIETN